MESPVYSSSVPAPLTFYRGGLNVGVFYAGPPVSPLGSNVFGNDLIGKAKEYRAQGEGNGLKNYGWILIISPEDILNFSMRISPEQPTVKNTSVYDGHYNKDQLSKDELARLIYYSPNSYRDWYIPSRDELAFIAKNLPKNFYLPLRFNSMTKKYLSSTFHSQNIVSTTSKKFSVLYSQSFYSPTYGDTFMVADTALMPIRLVRRVPVYLN